MNYLPVLLIIRKLKRMHIDSEDSDAMMILIMYSIQMDSESFLMEFPSCYSYGLIVRLCEVEEGLLSLRTNRSSVAPVECRK